MEEFQKPINKIEQKKNDFDTILESLKNHEFVEFEPEQKINFLNYAVQYKDYLLHGSNTNDIQQIEPRVANCDSKEFGNQKAIFANEDPLVTMFYSLKSKNFEGVAESGSFVDPETGKTEYRFVFRTNNPTSEYCISDGSIYLLERNSFTQGADDTGEEIDEWISSKPVKPVARIDIKTQDFPYLSQIKYIKEDMDIESPFEQFGVSSLGEFEKKYIESDQALMNTKSFDYKNPELINNQMKDALEKIDSSQVLEHARQKQAEMLWLWYHHAAQDAKERYQENEKAIEFIDKALEYKNISNIPNEITELLSLLYRDKLNEAELYIQNMKKTEMIQLEDGSVQEVANIEIRTARNRFEKYNNRKAN